MQVSTPALQHDAFDGRADDRRRKVTLTADAILIERDVEGVKMRICVPTATYGGLVIARSIASAAGFAIVLSHRDAELCVVVETAADAASLVSRLPEWAAFFGRPAVKPGACRFGRDGRRVRTSRPQFRARRGRGHAIRSADAQRHGAEINRYE